MPEFSVIIPVYNSEPTLGRCIDSVLNQGVRDFEVLCCYDESSDGSRAVIGAYCEKDGRVKFVCGRNRGLSGARNDGINAAQGNYVLFLDADDSLLKDAFSRIKEEFEARACDVVVFGTLLIPGSPRAPAWHRFVLKTPRKFYRRPSSRILFGEPSARPFVWRNAYTKSFLDAHKLCFDECLRVGEDHAFQIEAFPHASHGISFIPDRLYCYRWCRAGSLMDIYGRNKLVRLRGHIQMALSVFSYWSARGYGGLSRRAIAVWALCFIAEEIPYLAENQIAALAADIDRLCAEYISYDVLKSLPPFVRHKYFILHSHRKYSRIRGQLAFDTLWWYWYWGGIIGVFRTCVYLHRKRYGFR